MPLITICDGCGEEIEGGVTQGRYELEIPTGSEWWASERLTFHGRGCLAPWVDRTDPDGTFCPQCAPDALPPGADSPERVSEDHYGIRFDDGQDVYHVVPLIDGERTDYVTELLCGENGWAIIHVPEAPRCPIHEDFQVMVVYGNVTVTDRRTEDVSCP